MPNMPKYHILYQAKKKASRQPRTTPGRKVSGKTPSPPASVRVTPLYQELFKELYAAGYMRTDQIEAMLRLLAARDGLPLPTKSLRRTVQKNLRAMVQAALLKRIVPPVLPDARSGPPVHIYTLAKSGALMVADSLGMCLRDLGWRPADDVTYLFLNHVLSVVNYKLALMQACHDKGINLALWLGDRLLRRAPAKVTLTDERGGEVQVSVIPDAFYQLQLPSGRKLSCCLEIDRGTSTVSASKWQLKSWRRKVMAYQQLQAHGLPDSAWVLPGLIVTTVTTSPTRMAHLLSAAEDGGNRFWFTTFAHVNGETLLGAIWQVAGRGTTLHSLVPG
jgi:hypothetical protein